MKTKLLSSAALCLSLSLIFVESSYANSTPMPEKCPSVSAIKSVGVNHAEVDRDEWFAGQLNANYDTADSWTFVTGMFSAKDASEALAKANNGLKSLTYNKGPFKFDIYGDIRWACIYQANEGHWGVSVTPAMEKLNLAKNALRK